MRKEKVSGVMIIPTGIGCLLGGDAGFNPGVKLIAGCCENLIINPNSVNASDIQEAPENCWYTEGSIIDKMFYGEIKLKRPKSHNKILMVANPPLLPDSINAKNAGIWGLGADVELLELKAPLIMKATINKDGSAGGEFSGADELIKQVERLDFDVLAIHTPINCDEEVAKSYWENGGTNPWGQIEAQVSKYIANGIGKNVAHAPIEGQTNKDLLDLNHTKVVGLTMSPEIISKSFCFCILKGLHTAPVVSDDGFGVDDVDFLLTPNWCWGPAHRECFERGIPIIVVEENKTVFTDLFHSSGHMRHHMIHNGRSKAVFVKNYLEAAGLIMAMNAGVNYKTVIL
jgi:hypothetical protein